MSRAYSSNSLLRDAMTGVFVLVATLAFIVRLWQGKELAGAHFAFDLILAAMLWGGVQRFRRVRNVLMEQNAAKTHCKHDHEFTPENTGRNRHGGRYCRACMRSR